MELSCSFKSMQEQQKSLHVSCSSKHNFAYLVYWHCPTVRNTNLDNSKSGHLSGLENNLSFQTLRQCCHRSAPLGLAPLCRLGNVIVASELSEARHESL